MVAGPRHEPASPPLTSEDHQQIRDVLARFSHIFDNAQADILHLVFSPDLRLENTVGRGFRHDGLTDAETFTRAFPVGSLDHHTLDSVIWRDANNVVRARSRYLALLADGTIHGGEYLDIIENTLEGWRISYRLTIPRLPTIDKQHIPDSVLRGWDLAETSEPPQTEQAQQTRIVVRRFFEELLTQQRTDVAHEIIADDAVNEAFADPAQPGSRDDFLAHLSWVWENIAEATAHVDSILVEGNRAVVFWTLTGRQIGDFFGVTATGAPFRGAAVSDITLRHGRIARYRVHMDRAGITDMLTAAG